MLYGASSRETGSSRWLALHPVQTTLMRYCRPRVGGNHLYVWLSKSFVNCIDIFPKITHLKAKYFDLFVHHLDRVECFLEVVGRCSRYFCALSGSRNDIGFLGAGVVVACGRQIAILCHHSIYINEIQCFSCTFKQIV